MIATETLVNRFYGHSSGLGIWSGVHTHAGDVPHIVHRGQRLMEFQRQRDDENKKSFPLLFFYNRLGYYDWDLIGRMEYSWINMGKWRQLVGTNWPYFTGDNIILLSRRQKLGISKLFTNVCPGHLVTCVTREWKLGRWWVDGWIVYHQSSGRKGRRRRPISRR